MEVDGGGWRRMEEAGGSTAGGALVPRRILLSGVARVPVPPTRGGGGQGGAGRAPLLALAAAQLAAAAGAVLQRGLEPQPRRQREAVRRRQRRPHRAAHDSRGQPHPRSQSESEHVLSPRRRYTGSGGHGDGPPAGMGRVRPEGAAVQRLLQGGGERVAAGELPHPEVHHLLLPRGLPSTCTPGKAQVASDGLAVSREAAAKLQLQLHEVRVELLPLQASSMLLDVFSSHLLCVLLLCCVCCRHKARGQGRARGPGSGGGAGSPGPQSPRLAWHPVMADSQPGGWLLASFRVPRRPGSGEGAARGPVGPASSPERRPEVKVKVFLMKNKPPFSRSEGMGPRRKGRRRERQRRSGLLRPNVLPHRGAVLTDRQVVTHGGEAVRVRRPAHVRGQQHGVGDAELALAAFD